MSSGIKLTIVALVAFALGFAAARRFPPDPVPAEDLAWEHDGATVQLTAKAQGESYLIVQGGTGNADPSSKAALPVDSSPNWSVESSETIDVRSPMLAYRLSLVFACSGGTCNPCLPQDDCSPVSGPFGPVRRMQVWRWQPVGSGGRPPHWP